MHVSSCCLELRASMHIYRIYQRRRSAPQPKIARVVFGATHLSDAGAADTTLPPAVAHTQQSFTPPYAAPRWRHRCTQQQQPEPHLASLPPTHVKFKGFKSTCVPADDTKDLARGTELYHGRDSTFPVSSLGGCFGGSVYFLD